MNSHEIYDNPLVHRYASRTMAALWSPQRKFSTWRQLWVALAEAQRDLGLNIDEAQIEALRARSIRSISRRLAGTRSDSDTT